MKLAIVVGHNSVSQGTDGEVTVSTTDGHLHAENQTGNDLYLHFTVFGVAY